jgi:aldehyde:ferredoxin oxidoreductase
MSRKAKGRSSATRRSAATKRTRRKLEGGYHFRLLWVDLSRGQAKIVPFGERFALKYIGGRGFGAKILFDHHEDIEDPLSPENILTIAPGPLTGLYLPGAAKTHLVALAPLTGIYGDSNMGGNFGPELRQAGYDGLVLTGRAEQLCYLWIDEDDVQLVPAPDLAGKGSLDTERAVKDALQSEEVRVAAIGPAGENLVRFATINCDWSRNSGRCGMGAVLGSKNVKAIAVRGGKDLPVADPAELRLLTDRSLRELAEHSLFEFWQQQGLMSVVDYLNSAGGLPTRNFGQNVFEHAEQIDGFKMEREFKIGDTACFGCPMACGNICLVKNGKYKGTITEGPEYESACTLGSNLGVSDFSAILKGNQLCDELGIDTISAGVLIGALIEAVESGVLAPKEVDGMKLQWGDDEQIVALLAKIAHREGVGYVLAGGSKVVLERWPQLAPLVTQTKGMEQSAYDARATISMALAYGTSDIGAHHTRAWTVGKELEAGASWTDEDRVNIVLYHQTIRPLFDMLGVCRLPWIELGFDEHRYAQYYSAVTGVPHTLEDLLERSRALYDLTRLISVARGVSRKDDYPGPRMFERPIEGGQYEGRVVDRKHYEKLLDLYYQKRGWSEDGLPPADRAEDFRDGLTDAGGRQHRSR